MPRLLTGDKFFGWVNEDAETRERTAANKVARKDIRDGHGRVESGRRGQEAMD
jgi:hypothetical protein